jgi:hypothetical protein
MSIAEFSSILREQAYKNWFARAAVNIAKTPVSKLRDTEQRSTRNSLLITKDTIKDIVTKLVDREPTQAELDGVYNNLKSIRNNRSTRKSAVVLKNDGNLYFPGVTFDRISRILDAGFKDIVTDKKISDFFHKGHVYGLPTNIGYRTLEGISTSGIPDIMKEKLILMLGELITELERQDLATSNIKDSNYYLYAKYAKNRSKYLVEMQLGSENAEAGRDAVPITNAIRRYFDPARVVEISKNLRTRPEDAFIKQLIESHGSPSYKDLAIAGIISSLKGKPLDKKTYTVPKTLVASGKIKYSNDEIKQNNSKEIAELKKIKSKLMSAKSSKTIKSTASLEALLRAKLHDQIKRNMGTGNAKNVLNYRTGRFAKSATIERTTLSREGMVSVFYDYMRYPYATFSAGGLQESPKTRDPKTLISKSIREIGATMVGNRMRAVLV